MRSVHPYLDRIFQETRADVSGERGKTAAQRVYDRLRERIINLELPPNATLSRADIAAEYQVSQTPVRDALLQLEQDGLIKTYPQSRTVVTEIDPEQLLEVHFLRVAVEVEVARTLSLADTPGKTRKARAILQMQEALEGNVEEVSFFYELDTAFHEALFIAAGQPNLHQLLQTKAGHLARVRRLDLPSEGKMKDILVAHRAILEGVETGDETRATQAVRQHLSGTVSRLGRLIERNPGYFTRKPEQGPAPDAR